DDGQRIFAAWIVGGQYHEIAAPARGIAHQWALGPIAITTASEHCNHAPFLSGLCNKLAGQRSQIPQGVIRMRIIDHDRVRLSAVHALEAPGTRARFAIPWAIASGVPSRA